MGLPLFSSPRVSSRLSTHMTTCVPEKERQGWEAPPSPQACWSLWVDMSLQRHSWASSLSSLLTPIVWQESVNGSLCVQNDETCVACLPRPDPPIQHQPLLTVVNQGPRCLPSSPIFMGLTPPSWEAYVQLMNCQGHLQTVVPPPHNCIATLC